MHGTLAIFRSTREGTGRREQDVVPYAFVTVNRNEDGTVTVTNTVETSDADTTVAQRRAYRRLTTMAMIRIFFA